MKRLILLFSVSVLLTVQHLEAQTAVTDTVFLQLYNDSVDLKEVVVKGKMPGWMRRQLGMVLHHNPALFRKSLE